METKVLLLIVLTLLLIYFAHKNKVSSTKIAKPGEVSLNNKYINISSMKHDMSKIFFVNIVILLMSSPELSRVTFISFDNLSSSVIGKALIATCAFGLFHSVGQPLANFLPYF